MEETPKSRNSNLKNTEKSANMDWISSFIFKFTHKILLKLHGNLKGIECG